MKKYFQKIYNETGRKPFTFLNCFLCVFTPIIALILGYMINKSDPTPAIVLLIVITILSLAGNIFILFKRFNDVKRALLLALLNIFASIHFFCKLILFPLIKLAMRFSLGATQMQMGNTAGASHTMSNATASAGVKTSAFNWFKYDGTTIADIAGTEPEDDTIVYTNNAYETSLGRSFTDQEDMNARNMGYQNAQHAANSGVRIEDITK